MTAAIGVQHHLEYGNGKSAKILHRLLHEESGQDLIEYALVFSLVALGAVASMKSLSASIVGVFAAIGTTLTSAI